MSTKELRAEAIASLREAVRELHITAGLDSQPTEDAPPVVIGVTSPNFGEGKTTVAMALAGSLSTDFGANVMLVDGDLHTPSLGREYGIDTPVGLWDVASGSAKLETAATTWHGMRILTSGRSSGNPARFAHSAQLSSVFEQMKRGHRYVVIDLPSSLHSMTAPALAKRCTGVVVVVRSGKTTTGDLDRTLHLLNGANVLGVVINRSKSNVPEWMSRLLRVRG